MIIPFASSSSDSPLSALPSHPEDGSFFKVKKSDVLPEDTSDAGFCEYCDREFTTVAETVSHKEDAHHYCRECDRLFRNGIQQDDHFANAAVHAYKGRKGEDVKIVDRTGYCSTCHTRFPTHAEAVAHKEDWHEYCTECDALFPTGEEQQRHFDADPVHVWRALAAAKKVGREAGTPASQTTGYRVTTLARNHQGGYDCYFCDGRPFLSYSSLAQLQTHLDSTDHNRWHGMVHKCPTCRRRTETFAELVEHAEMDGCGIIPSLKVEKEVDELASGVAWLGI